ncbi:MAG: DNA-deoxyinosine glycosylase [Bacilli bacterium]
MIHNLDPIYNKNSKILILGSLPSVISRNANFYYANKNNRFWKIFEILFNVELSTNESKKEFLLNNNIALWDVIKSCEINGSSDSSIKNIKVNDIEKILHESNISCVFCTGKTAYNNFIKYFDINIDVIYLPSPSSANAIKSIGELVDNYKVIVDKLN